MKYERLNNLALQSIEHDILCETDCTLRISRISRISRVEGRTKFQYM